MKRHHSFAALVGAAALIACAGDATTSPANSAEHTESIQLVGGARVANLACAQCHGFNLLGAVTEAGITPSLTILRTYTDTEFEALLAKGTSRDGRLVVPEPVVAKLTTGDRQALKDFLLSLREPE